MVDRITPVTTEEDKAYIQSHFGIDDAWPVVCEPFIQWIIEDNFKTGRPELEAVGVQFVEDVHPYETMKIRLLNASHSAMGYLGYLAGFEYIYEIATDPSFRKMVQAFMDEEATPVVPEVKGIDLKVYKATLIERFSNPTIKDQAARICLDGSAKMPKFVIPTIIEQLERDGDIKYGTLCVAAWFRYLSGTDESGNKIEIDDPMAELLVQKAQEGGKNPRILLGISEIFPEKLTKNQRFVNLLEEQLVSLYENGARATLEQVLSN
ncbi:MAG: mannitol dehydrogenase family protein [Bdellovibrionota bacterium]